MRLGTKPLERNQFKCKCSVFLCLLMGAGGLPGAWGQVRSAEAKEAQTHSIVKSLIMHGLEAYETGQEVEALNDFSRVLLLNPENRLAREYLMKLTLPLSGGTAADYLHLVRYQDLQGYLRKIQGRMRHLKEKYRALQSQLSVEGLVHPILHEDPLANYQEVPLGVFDSGMRVQDVRHPLAEVNEGLDNRRRQLVEAFEYLKMQYLRLRNLHTPTHAMDDRRLAAGSSGYTQGEGAWRPSRGAESVMGPGEAWSPQGFHSEPTFTRGGPKESDPQRELLEQNLQALRDEVGGLKDMIALRDDKTARLMEQVVDISLELAEKESGLDEKQKLLQHVKDELNELKGRFQLGQRMMREKDDQIQGMQSNLDELNTALNKYNGTFQQESRAWRRQLAEFQGVLAIYKEQLGETTRAGKMKTAHIRTLEDQLVLVQRQVVTKDKDLQKAKNDLSSLQEQLDIVQKRVLELQNLSQWRNIQSSVPGDEVEALQTRLSDIHAFLLRRLMDLEEINQDLAVSDLRAIDHILKSSTPHNP